MNLLDGNVSKESSSGLTVQTQSLLDLKANGPLKLSSSESQNPDHDRSIEEAALFDCLQAENRVFRFDRDLMFFTNVVLDHGSKYLTGVLTPVRS